MDKWFLRRSGPVFYPPRLWVEPVDNRGRLWTAESCAHSVHRRCPFVPSDVPRNTQVLPSPIHHAGVMRFTPTGERPCFVVEQWTGLWRSGPVLGTTRPSLWASGGQPVRRSCGRMGHPQSVDSGCPQIHRPPNSPDEYPAAGPVDTFGTTRASPGCGRGTTAPSCGETFLSPVSGRCDRTTKSAPGVGPGRCGGTKRGAGRLPDGPVSALDAVGELGDLVVDGAPFGHQRADLAVRVHDGRVVAAAEQSPDLGQ